MFVKVIEEPLTWFFFFLPPFFLPFTYLIDPDLPFFEGKADYGAIDWSRVGDGLESLPSLDTICKSSLFCAFRRGWSLL